MFYRDVRDLWRKIFDDAATDQYSADTAENGLDGNPFFRGADSCRQSRLPTETDCRHAAGKFLGSDRPEQLPDSQGRWFYEYYGDPGMIQKYYEADCAYMDYLRTKITEDGFIAHGLGDWGNPQAGAQATANVGDSLLL